MTTYEELYERLKKEKLQVTAGLEQLKIGGQRGEERREGTPFGKSEEEASEAFELEKRLALEQKLNGTLTRINRAIDKYETGTYGLCDSCGRPIENERLEALPQASLCLNCKAQKAKNAKGAI